MSKDDVSETRAVVDAVCQEMGLDRWDANTVADMVDRDPSTWAPCCGSSCDPCNDVLAGAARAALVRLRRR